MNIQPINSYTQLNTAKNKDLEFNFYGFRTPYQEAMDDLERKFFIKMEQLEAKFVDKSSKERIIEIDKLWKWKDATDRAIREKFGIIKKRNIFQKIFNLK